MFDGNRHERKKHKEQDAKDILLGTDIAYPKKGLEDTVPFPRLRICFYETDWTLLIKSHQWAVTKTWYRRITEVMYRSDGLTFLHLFEWCCHTRRQYHWIQVPTAVTKTLVICCTHRIMLPSYIGISALLSRKSWSVLQLVSRALRSKVENPLIFRDYFISHYEDSFINESTNQDFLECHSRVWPSLFEAKFVVSSPGLLLRFDNIPHGELFDHVSALPTHGIFSESSFPPKKTIEQVFQL